jgi:hypothetical protein
LPENISLYIVTLSLPLDPSPVSIVIHECTLPLITPDTEPRIPADVTTPQQEALHFGKLLQKRRNNNHAKLHCFFHLGYLLEFELFSNDFKDMAKLLKWTNSQTKNRKKLARKVFEIFSFCGRAYINQVRDITPALVSKLSDTDIHNIVGTLIDHHTDDIELPEDTAGALDDLLEDVLSAGDISPGSSLSDLLLEDDLEVNIRDDQVFLWE